jgi:hypothetical protein
MKLCEKFHPTQEIFLLGLLHGMNLLQAVARQQSGTQFQTVEVIQFSHQNPHSWANFQLVRNDWKFSVKAKPMKLHSLTNVQGVHQADLWEKTRECQETN